MQEKILKDLSKELSIKKEKNSLKEMDDISESLYWSFAKNMVDDANITAKADNNQEANPIIKQLGTKSLGTKLYFTGIAAGLRKRWEDMDPKQRAIEMLLANAIEAYALNSWKEPWKVNIGINF